MATSAAAGVYVTSQQPSVLSSAGSTSAGQQLSQLSQPNSVEETGKRADYKPVPLENITSGLQGSDPSTIALNAFGNIESEGGSRKVEVAYPQPGRAVVTITQTGVADDSVGAIRYRVELTTVGRSLLVKSPPPWQIEWAGSQVKCWPGRGHQDWSTELCQ